jgi:hypothetical protein
VRGTFRFAGSGSFQTSSGGSGIAAIIAAVLAILALEWIAAHLWWILAGTAVLAAAAVASLWQVARKYHAPSGGHRWTAVATGAPSGPPVTARPATAIRGPREVHYHFEIDPATIAALMQKTIRTDKDNPAS